MEDKIKVEVEILDHRVKDGWFGRSYYVTLKMVHQRLIGEQVREWKVSLDTYYKMEIGRTYFITYYRNSEGTYYPWKEVDT